METGDLDEDELDELDEKLELDYQIGEDLKEKVRLPSFRNATRVYTHDFKDYTIAYV